MALQRVTLRLTELRCLQQSEGSNGSEPYLWTTFFAFGAQQLPGQTGPLAVHTPTYDAFRTEFPNGMTAGEAAVVPSFVSMAIFDMDLDITTVPRIVGCIAVLLEEDETPQSSMVVGRIAYSKEIEVQLQAFANRRIQTGDFGPITDQEIADIRAAVDSKVRAAIRGDQGWWGLLTRDQDDIIGFTYKVFQHPVDESVPVEERTPDIAFQYFQFPVLGSGSDRFELTGNIYLGPIPVDPVDLCSGPRTALKEATDRIEALQRRRSILQDMLGSASPAQKAALIAEIRETAELLAYYESQLPELQAALDRCGASPIGGGGVVVDTDTPVVLDTQ